MNNEEILLTTMLTIKILFTINSLEKKKKLFINNNNNNNNNNDNNYVFFYFLYWPCILV